MRKGILIVVEVNEVVKGNEAQNDIGGSLIVLVLKPLLSNGQIAGTPCYSNYRH